MTEKKPTTYASSVNGGDDASDDASYAEGIAINNMMGKDKFVDENVNITVINRCSMHSLVSINRLWYGSGSSLCPRRPTTATTKLLLWYSTK